VACRYGVQHTMSVKSVAFDITGVDVLNTLINRKIKNKICGAEDVEEPGSACRW